jgi:hypothetical protein
MSAFNDLNNIFEQAKKEIAVEELEDGINPVACASLFVGVSVFNDPKDIIRLYTKESFEDTILRILEFDESPELLKRGLKSYYRAYGSWGLWFPIYECVHISYLPYLFKLAEEYYNS